MRPLGQRDGGAGLLIGGEVGQIVVHSEPLVMRAGADAAGDILIALRGVAPDAVKHLEQALVAGLRRHVRDPGHQVSRPHGVALDVLVIVDRHVVLQVRAVVFVQRRLVFGGEELPAAVLDEEARQLEIAAVAGGSQSLTSASSISGCPG